MITIIVVAVFFGLIVWAGESEYDASPLEKLTLLLIVGGIVAWQLA